MHTRDYKTLLKPMARLLLELEVNGPTSRGALLKRIGYHKADIITRAVSTGLIRIENDVVEITEPGRMVLAALCQLLREVAQLCP